MAYEKMEFVMVGGGIAGLSTAFHLANAGHGRGVMVVDREDLPGFYSSGHNAGVGRQLTGRAEHTTLTVEGRNRLAEAGLMDRSGGLLLGAEAGGTAALAEEALQFGLDVVRGAGSPQPGLQAAEHLGIPSDGVIDVDAMLRHCAEGARERGATLHYGREVRGIHRGSDGFEIETDQGTIRTRYLVNAAGGWAQALGAQAGGLDIAFKPLRRHLIWSNAPTPADRSWAWYADRPLYVRPESGGLLLCACEEDLVPLPARHTQPESDPVVLEGLSQTLREVAPGLAELPIARLWCGLRTFAPDRRFVLGADPLNPDLHWVAGLGGHGMTSGLAVGSLAARILMGQADAGPLAAARLLETAKA